MKTFKNLMRFIFKKRPLFHKSYIFLIGYIPRNFQELLKNICSFNSTCKILHFSQKENLCEIKETIGNPSSVVMIVKYNKTRRKLGIIIKQNCQDISISLNVQDFTPYFSKIFFGNANKWSRTLFIFQPIFDERPELRIFKLLISFFLNSKTTSVEISPSFDHVFGFFHVNANIIFRVYQILKKKKDSTKNRPDSNFQMIEIGPRIKFKIENFKVC